MNEQFFLPLFQAVDSTSLKKLRDNFYLLAIRYTVVRAQWNFISVEEKIETNDERTRLHNTLIDSLNILSRNMAKAGEETAWRKTLGDNRKVIGDFACYVVAWLGIRQR
ncbi:MAG: hypothetical protein IPH20_17150 [Bacteroidales bacterium]|nr:hypothetical protein [Bacteroidales bacterium]